MFKRANKVTALLVAAASVMSIVPAMASTRLGVKDGHIKGQAFAYDNGKYIYEGYRTNDDDNGIYYNDGSSDKEKQNEDLKDYELVSKYGTKYAYAKDGNDQYLVDLTTGKIVDDETPEDKADEVKSKLRSALKKTDRYARTGSWDTISVGDTSNFVSGDGYNLSQFRGFGDVWYKYGSLGDKNSVGTTIGNGDTYAKVIVQLPATVPASGTYSVDGTILPAYANTITKADFAKLVINALVNSNAVRNAFDVTTLKYDSTLNQITGTAKNVGHTAVAGYAGVVGYGLGEGTTPAAVTTTGASVALDAVVKAEGSRLKVDVDAAKALVATVTDADTRTLYYSRLNNITIVGDTVQISATTMAAVNLLASNPNAATVTDYSNAGVTTVVVDSAEVPGLTLGLTKANGILAKAIANGTLADGLSDAYARQQKIKALIADAIAQSASNSQANLYIVDGKLANDGAIGVRGNYIGFVNESAKYIDASATANIYAYSQAQHKTVKVKEFDKENQDYHITATLLGLTALTQDKDYIYALAHVAVAERNYAVKEQYFIQKLSKAQGDTKDGAYLPKSVDSYQLDNETIYDCGDSTVAYHFLATTDHIEDGFNFRNITVKDGNLYITGSKDDNSDHDKVKVFKIVLKKDKIDAKDGTKDVDVYIAKKDGDSDIDVKDGTRASAIAYDVDGNTWVISKGTITKFNGTEKKEMYTTDRSFDHLDVYDDNNLIAWDQDNEVYTTVQEGTKKTQDESTAVAPVVVTGWVKGTDGTWTFNDATGAKVTSKWINSQGAWYYLKADGIMATGWYNDNGTWYYLNPASGAMATGWLNDNGTWYYLAGSGAMLSNTTVDGYQLGASGAWIK